MLAAKRGSRWRWLVLLPLGVLLFWHLGERPLHHDEGVNGWFLERLLRHGEYHYDPTNYHGPTLYFLEIPVVVAAWLAGGAGGALADAMSEATLRAGTALAALLVLAALLGAADLLGAWGATAAALLLGTSCATLFFARDFIHETWLVLFTLLFVVAALRFARSRRFPPAAVAAASFALALATKETFPLSVAALAAAALGAELGGGARPGGWRSALAALSRPLVGLGWRRCLWLVGIAVAIWLVFFSSFFTEARGPLDALRAYLPWGREAVHSVHEKPATYYLLTLLGPYEPALILGGCLALGLGVLWRDRLALFFGLWWIATLAIYSVIPYKTPWLASTLLLPAAVAAGRAVELLVAALGRRGRRHWLAAAPLALLAIVWMAALPRALRVVYREWDDPRHPQVYAQTVRGFRTLLAAIDQEAARRHGRDTPIEVTAPSYWPLPFYLRGYSSVAYWGKIEGARLDAPLIVAGGEQEGELASRLAGYGRASFDLRPGVRLDLWSRPEPAPANGPAPRDPGGR
ncbi:MAG: flippase activity-associated protein Agl23 [Acidobacteriota bacterium]